MPFSLAICRWLQACRFHRDRRSMLTLRSAVGTFASLLVAGVVLGIASHGARTAQASDAAALTTVEAERLFAIEIHPWLVAKCWACHADRPDELAGELDLRSAETAMRGGESGEPLWVAGQPQQSRLLRAVSWIDPDLRMPPKEADRLTADQLGQVQRWIEAGAPWPASERIRALQTESTTAERQPVRTRGGLTAEWDQRPYALDDLWAYRPLQNPRLPRGTHADQALDALINARLEAAGLTPAPRADRRTLIRRATFDLLGLPPTADEVARFLADSRSDEVAFAALVDRLLASPHYGEQMARHWLDVVRYADTAGLANDYERPNAWRYRDYVVRAFNDDLPYGDFIRQQIAGDELDESDANALIAVGFLRMGPWEQTAMSVAKLSRQQFLDDVTDSVGQVFLAQSLQCCRCHDHKYDPLPTRDYYRVQAIFATTQFAERAAPFLPQENQRRFDTERQYLEQRIERYSAIADQIAAKGKAAAQAWFAARGRAYADRDVLLAQGVAEDELPPRHLGLDPRDFGWDRIADKNRVRHRWELDRFAPLALSVYSGGARPLYNVQSRLPLPAADDRATPAETTSILLGGDPFAAGDVVEPGVLSCVAEWGFPTPEIPSTLAGRRRAFADWLAIPHHPLVARAIVNRVWQWHFGVGLAANANNFGATGARPSHPELLDWLALNVARQDGSIKQLHRLIMNSDTYCRAAEHPHIDLVLASESSQRLYAVAIPRRLAAEELRDAMLAVSGELNRELGGLPVRPEIDLETALQPRQIMGTYAPAYQPSPLPQDRHRRSLYAQRIRGLRDPLAEVFNQPNADRSCERREASTIPPQALMLLNSPQVLNRAVAMAVAVSQQTTSLAEAIDLAFVRAYGRPPTLDERQTCVTHAQQMARRHATLSYAPESWPMTVRRQAVEEMSGEVFEFIEELETNRDFVPDLQLAQVSPELRGLAEVCLVLFNSNEFVFVD